MESTYFAIAFVSGLIPALFWVWFWLREDARKPEPYFLIAISFIAGMAVVPMVLPLQKLAFDLYSGENVMLVWVIIEEVLKYAAALALVFWNREVDEPIDMVIYLIVIALGFAALENALFIFNPLVMGEYLNSVLTGGFRFLGAMCSLLVQLEYSSRLLIIAQKQFKLWPVPLGCSWQLYCMPFLTFL
jgi:RsiW-degrading membrane proteinase PrsW (M82 family)